MDSEAARKELCRFSGVGEKVADCVLLYSGIRKDLCPIDTWVEKTIKERYLDENATKKDIRKFTESYFGNYAGYAQLWFFYFARNN
jgi:N-glycosylase/DNA lyase